MENKFRVTCDSEEVARDDDVAVAQFASAVKRRINQSLNEAGCHMNPKRKLMMDSHDLQFADGPRMLAMIQSDIVAAYE